MIRRGVLTEEQFSWYESSLPLKERKKRGHFSTPPRLVEAILDACGYTLEADLAEVRVLDPACGSGNFLAGIAQRLGAFGKRMGMSQEECMFLISRNLWGFDPDPISCFLAEMQLRAVIDEIGLVPDLHIHQADSLTLPWEPCVDLFVANPPYLAAKNTDLSGYRFARQRGQADSYLLFLNLALSVVRPGGWMGLVLPDPVLARANASKERAGLLQEFTLHSLWHLSGVFPADVGAVVIIAQKNPPKPVHRVSWVRGQWGEGDSVMSTLNCGRRTERIQEDHESGRATARVPTASPSSPRPYYDTEWQQSKSKSDGNSLTIPQSLLLRQCGAELRYLLGSEEGAVVERLRVALEKVPARERRLARLEEFLTISRGEELGRESPYLVELGLQMSHRGRAGELEGRAEKLVERAGKPVERAEELVERAGKPVERAEELEGRGKKPDGRGKKPDGRPQGSPLLYTNSSLCQVVLEGGLEDGPSQYYPVLRGGIDIRAYSTPEATWGIAREAVVKPLERYLCPKLLVVKSTDRLQAALDMRGHVVLQTLYLLSLRGNDMGEDDLYFFLALLNSRLLRNYVYMLHTAYKWVQPQIEQRVLASLPVPIVEKEERRPIIERAKLLVAACSRGASVVEWREDIPMMYEEQEHAIGALYAAVLVEGPDDHKGEGLATARVATTFRAFE